MKSELASIVFTVYNQERYVRESLLSAIRQGYEPLEIVVSDDASSDGTCETIDRVIMESGFKLCDEGRGDTLIRRFRKGEKTIIVNFNQKNRGICANFEYAFGLTHGELVFTFGGDDISMLNRVEKVMAAWIADGKRAKVLAGGGWLMDVDGKNYREYRREVLDGAPVGAFNAYARCVYEDFPKITQKFSNDTYEDSIYGLRAQFFEAPLYIDELLVRYRFGSGVSTGGVYRQKLIRGARAVRASCEQLLIDLDSLVGRMSDKRREDFQRTFKARIEHEKDFLNLLEGRNLYCRLSGYWRCRYFKGSLKMIVLGVIWLLPPKLGDWFLEKV